MKSSLLRPLLEAAVVLFLVLSAARWLTGLFTRQTEVFQTTTARQLRLLFWPLMALGAGLSAVPTVLMGTRPATPVEWALATVFFGITLLLAGPALVLHARYWVLNRETTLLFQPKQNVLEVYAGGQRLPFERRDLALVERVTCRNRRTFRAPYDYLRLHLHGGRTIVLTSLLTDLEPIANFLRSVPAQKRAVAWCWV